MEQQNMTKPLSADALETLAIYAKKDIIQLIGFLPDEQILPFFQEIVLLLKTEVNKRILKDTEGKNHADD